MPTRLFQTSTVDFKITGLNCRAQCLALAHSKIFASFVNRTTYNVKYIMSRSCQDENQQHGDFRSFHV